MGARLNDDGSTSVGLQWRQDDRWNGITPRLSVLPAEAESGKWYASSSVKVPVRRIEAEIRVADPDWSRAEFAGGLIVTAGDREWRAECGWLRIQLSDSDLRLDSWNDCDEWKWSPLTGEVGEHPSGEGDQLVRVLGRPLSGGVIELGLQRFVAGKWQPLDQPAQPWLSLTRRNRWTFTRSFALPLLPPMVHGDLRPGASISTRDGRMWVQVDGEEKVAHCGTLWIGEEKVTMSVTTLSTDCSYDETLFSLCGTNVNHNLCDLQQRQVYNWETQHDVPANIDVGLADIVRIVEAVYSDYVLHRTPPLAEVIDLSFSSWNSDDHRVYISRDHAQLDTVLHETAHAIVDGVGLGDVGHGPNYAATILEVFGRYAPLIDTRVMRENASRMGVRVASRGPQAVSDDGISVVRDIVCGLGAPGQEMCDAFGAQAAEISDHSAVGRFIGGGRAGSLSWNSSVQDDGSLWASVMARSAVEGQRETEAWLELACSRNSELLVRLWWPGALTLSPSVDYRSGLFGWTGDRWIVRQNAWNGFHQYLLATRASEVIEDMMWASGAGYPWSIRFNDQEHQYEVTFDLAGLFDTPAQANMALCGLDLEQATTDRFVGHGRLPSGWYGAGDDDDGLLRSYLHVESEEREAGESIARLSIHCVANTELSAHVSWRAIETVPSTLSYRVGEGPWRTERWRTSSDTRSEVLRAFHTPLDPIVFLHRLIWLAGDSSSLVVQYEKDGTTYNASFDLAHAFDTPVQRNFAQCGTRSEVRETAGHVIDWGQLGEKFWWGVVVADEDDPGDESYEAGTVRETYVVLQTTIVNDDDSIARLQISCVQDVPRVGIYWEVSPAVDHTVKIGLADSQMESQEWGTGTSNWGEYRFKVNGLEGAEALELWTGLYWAAQRGALLNVESHARNRPSQMYTATFDLDGLFETPVQPNLARCGR